MQRARDIVVWLSLMVGAVGVAVPGSAWSAEGEPTATWPQWRGPSRDGRIPTTTWPADLKQLTQVWRQPLEPSYSGPIVASDRVFVTETRDRKVEAVSALRRDNGQVLWTAQWDGALSVPFFAKENGDWIRSTPAYDGERLYVAGMRDVLVALDAASGQEVWRLDFVKELGSPVPDFGFVSSPLVRGDALFVQAGASCVRVDKHSGKVVWQTLKDGGGMLGSAFSSPVLATLLGQEQLIVQTRDRLAAVAPEDGKELWQREIPAFRGMNILTPTIIGDTIFTSAYGGKSLLIGTRREGDKFETDEVWANKVQAYMSSPVVIDNHVYVHLRNQRFACIDLATGKEKWITKPYGKYWSMVANGDRVLALDQRGELLLIRANPEAFELLDSRKVSEESTWAHVALCGQEIFVRELNAMSVYRWE